MRYVEQLADSEQTNALAHLLRYGLEQIIDGRKCLVIPIDDEVEVNGISVNAK